MLINEFEVKEYLEDARELSTDQFKDKPIYNKYLQMLLSGAIELQEVYRQLMQERSLNTAIGAQLDMIGNLVGQPRILANADLKSFFGYFGDWHADSFGTFYNDQVGSAWWDGETAMTGSISLNDDLYRLLIRARIAKNVTRATPEDVMLFANFVFDTKGSTVTDEGGAAFTLLIGKELTRTEIGFLRWVYDTGYYETKLLPKPVGVDVNYGSFDYDAFFAFQGVPNAKGYGSTEYAAFYDGEIIFDGSYIPHMIDGKEGGKWARSYDDVLIEGR